nr:MAG TPA: hypothetical protein [Bacteriophage sp.]
MSRFGANLYVVSQTDRIAKYWKIYFSALSNKNMKKIKNRPVLVHRTE